MKKTGVYLSVALNLLGIFMAIFVFLKLGGFVYFENRLANAISDKPSVNPIVEIRNENLKLVGNEQKDIVFVGDSHTNYFEWGEYFSEYSVANRGIGSDTSEGVLNRINQITELRPDKVFIMVGINDIQQGVPLEKTEQNFKAIITELSKSNIDIFIQSVFPVADELYERNSYRDSEPVNESVQEMNDMLADLKGVTYIDIYSEIGHTLPEKYTVDGIHLNENGYDRWLEIVEVYVRS